MNKANKMITVISMWLICTVAFGQSIDQDRMNRDLKVAENILSTLSNENQRSWGGDDIESNYIPGYGVIFTVPIKSSVLYVHNGRAIRSTDRNRITVRGFYGDDESEEIVIAGNAVTTEKNKSKDKDKEKDKDREIVKSEGALKESIQSFLADYAGLISQLDASDRVVVQLKDKNQDFFFPGMSNDEKKSAFTAEVMVKDLNSQREGKISRDKLLQLIKFTEEEVEEVAKDIKLFATIFSRLYEPDLSETYYLSSRNLAYTKLDELGVTFNMKFYSSSSESGLHTIRTTGESGLSQAERDSRVDAMYPAFEQSFKENLVDYGRTIKSLKPSEKLIFKAKMTQCVDCEMPEKLTVSIDAKVLFDFNDGKLSRDKAIEKIQIVKN